VACALIRFAEWKLAAPGTKVEFHTEARFDALMYGAIAAIVLQHESWRAWIEKRMTPITVVAFLGLTLLLVVAFPAMPVRRTFVAIAMPLLVAGTVLAPSSLIGRALEAGWLRYIGRLSYSLYLWQMLFFTPRNELGWIQTFPGAAVCAVLCALASYYLIEQPAIAFGRKWASARRRTIPAGIA
jgi:peptidoglycan/LPS O-acetylase OafA/YrhL